MGQSPQEFIEKWGKVELKERSAAQSHFNDLCGLLGLADPTTADPKGEWFMFEKGATKSTGGEGWADVWRKECFAWEYKGKRKDLDAALTQLQQYALALDNPPLLIVSDMEHIRIHTNWTNTVHKTYTIKRDDLLDAATRDLLKAAFTDPEKLKPAKTRALLTEEAAEQFAKIAQSLRGRGHKSEDVAHFVIRLVFCMFAEDVNLLPDKMFENMLKLSKDTPADFVDHAKTLFAAMKSPGGRVGFTKIEWFNGGLFDDDTAFSLLKPDIEDLIKAAELDWSDIDPSILGTLFERGLDPDKRSQLGAHYTDRAKIMQIVNPVIVEPLMAEWAVAKLQIEIILKNAPRHTTVRLSGPELTAHNRAIAAAEAKYYGFLERLKNFRVLDPACGSGNFLYLSLIELKNIERRVIIECEALGLSGAFSTVGPECVLGIELNPYAAELARVSVWIGEIQWMRRNGYEAARNPILRTLNTIECRDAILNADGTRAEWPKADVVVGNPPFLGNKKMIRELSEDYTAKMRGAWPEVSGGSDLVCYWFAKAWAQMISGKLQRAGLVATNSIRGGSNREVLKPIVEDGTIFNAWSDEEWTVDGAAVRVSLVCFSTDQIASAVLNGQTVDSIVTELTSPVSGGSLLRANTLAANQNTSYQGAVRVGPFNINGDVARKWLQSPSNADGSNNSQVLRRIRNGSDVTRRPRDEWLVDFFERSESEAAMYELPFEYALQHVKPYRANNRRELRRINWWKHGETGTGMRSAISKLARVLVTPQVAKHRVFAWTKITDFLESTVIIFARDDDTTFGILHSRFHELWSLRMGTFLGVGNDPRYTPSTTFETFPFPEGLTPNIPAADYEADPRAIKIAVAASRLNELRENWLNPPDLVKRVPEVAAGYPDRILPINEAAAESLKNRTLTKLYNQRPAWLDNAHKTLDEAVAEAYGWGDDWRAGKLIEDEILARLFKLNQERSSGH